MAPDVEPPYAILAELTHRCPLKCLYCSNPLELIKANQELSTAQWVDAIEQAAKLGVLQIHFSGGEPLVRADLEILVKTASANELYSNLITSGLGLTEKRMNELVESGLDSVQLSLQSFNEESSFEIAGVAGFDRKCDAARLVRKFDLPLTANVVLHRLNLDFIEQIIETCLKWGATRIELANTQFYGWALKNSELLMPSKSQLDRARAVFESWREKISPAIELIWVMSDYYEQFPKPCMGGWAKLQMTVCPDGQVLPCPVAGAIDTLPKQFVQEQSLSRIWFESPTFNAFRGDFWMQDPCRSCERRFEDFGGCRCQAFALTGDAARTDPVCMYSHDRSSIDERLDRATASLPGEKVFRQPTWSLLPGKE